MIHINGLIVPVWLWHSAFWSSMEVIQFSGPVKPSIITLNIQECQQLLTLLR